MDVWGSTLSLDMGVKNTKAPSVPTTPSPIVHRTRCGTDWGNETLLCALIDDDA